MGRVRGSLEAGSLGGEELLARHVSDDLENAICSLPRDEVYDANDTTRRKDVFYQFRMEAFISTASCPFILRR